MAYTPTSWIDHITEYPNRWTLTPNSDGTITLIPAFGDVVQAGTPISAFNMNKIEKGIEDAHDAIDGITIPVTSVAGKTGDVTLTPADVGAAPANHTHAAGDINSGVLAVARIPNLSTDKLTSGTLPLARGGTGGTTAAAARTQLGLTGNSNTSHYHDSRYVRTRLSGGLLEYLDGSTWKVAGGVKNVQRGITATLNIDSMSTTLNTDLTISAVNLNKAVVNLPYSFSQSRDDGYHVLSVTARLINATTLRITCQRANAGHDGTFNPISWEVIEYN